MAEGPSPASVEDLLFGGSVRHVESVPEQVLDPFGRREDVQLAEHQIVVRPLTLGMLEIISRAARDDAGLVPVLMIKEAVEEPALTADQIRSFHVGLVHWLLGVINRVSGISANGDELRAAGESSIGRAHLRLAERYGWTPDQVAQLTPAQSTRSTWAKLDTGPTEA